MVLPEIGGRIHVGLDKTNGYDFFYRQNVIKPALVGLAGPVDFGRRGIQLAAASSAGDVMPVEAAIERHADGSGTIWCSDHDPMDRTERHARRMPASGQGLYGIESAALQPHRRLCKRFCGGPMLRPAFMSFTNRFSRPTCTMWPITPGAPRANFRCATANITG